MNGFFSDLRAALDSAGELLLGTAPSALPKPLPPGVHIVVTTSGSTSGIGRPVGLTPGALIASAAAAHAYLGGPGQWLLTLPHEHIAGLQVCARSLLAGHTPVVRGADESLSAAAARMTPGVRHYTSLVPTQLVRVLEEGGADLAALTRLHGILLGGSAVDPGMLARARGAGLRIHTTYGSTETSGGCVYDGTALPGTVVRIDDDGRIRLGGATLAWGYLDDGPTDFFTEAGVRWFRTGDLGRIDPSTGRLRVLGRVDDVIISGGVNVHPTAVEISVREVPGVIDCVVVGLDSDEWGEEVIALVCAPEAAEPDLLQEIRAHVRGQLGAAAAPRGVVVVDALPTRGPGKVDRRAATTRVAAAFEAGRGARHR